MPKMVSVITRYFGLSQVNMAEDIVQDTLLEAIHNWEYKGIPENPSAWLYTVARNKAINWLKRNKYEDIIRAEINESSIDLDFSEEQIADDQLRMMFACLPSWYFSGGTGKPDAQNALWTKHTGNRPCFSQFC